MSNLKIEDKEKPTDEKEDNYSVIELKITNEAIELTDSYSGDSIIMTNACWSELIQAVNEKRGDL